MVMRASSLHVQPRGTARNDADAWCRRAFRSASRRSGTIPPVELARLELLGEGEEHAGGPGEGHEAGDGDHPLEEAPLHGKVVLAAERRVVEEREVVRRAH